MHDYPLVPNHVGERKRIKDQDGNMVIYRIKDEIVEMENKEKAVYLQQLEFTDGREEYRLAYWIIGKKGMATGKWVFGQFAPMVSKEIFVKILDKARVKGWFAL